MVCRSQGAQSVNQVEQEAAQDSAEENTIDLVNINSIHFNKNFSILTVNLKMSAGPNNAMVPYKVNMNSDGNIMPLQMYKILFPKITSEQLVATINNNVQLRMYNKTTIAQLGTYVVEVEHKNNKKKCRFFEIPSNGQALHSCNRCRMN